ADDGKRHLLPDSGDVLRTVGPDAYGSTFIRRPRHAGHVLGPVQRLVGQGLTRNDQSTPDLLYQCRVRKRPSQPRVWLFGPRSRVSPMGFAAVAEISSYLSFDGGYNIHTGP